ncbi:MAG: hypothetical protein IT215_00560 [Chitinophagaceae bacterium]|nr:hypothetical protein [Chitinophagaceae bacterium]
MPKLKPEQRNCKLLMYFKDGNARTFHGSYKNENASLKRLENLILEKFKGTYNTALIYLKGDSEPIVKYVNDLKLI